MAEDARHRRAPGVRAELPRHGADQPRRHGRGFRDLEESIAIAERANSPWHITRGQSTSGSRSSWSATSRRDPGPSSATSRPPERFGIAGRDHLEPRGGRVRPTASRADGTSRSRSTTPRSPGSRRARPTTSRSQHRQSRRGSGGAEATWRGRSRTPTGRSTSVGRRATHRRCCPAWPSAQGAPRRGPRGRGRAVVEEILGLNAAEPSLDWSWWILQASIVLTAQGRGDDLLALGGEGLPSRLGARGAALGIGRPRRRGGPPRGDGCGAGRGVRADEARRAPDRRGPPSRGASRRCRVRSSSSG